MAAPGVQGENRSGLIARVGEVIAGKRPASVWAQRHEALAMGYEFQRQATDTAYAAGSNYRAALGEAEGRLGRLTDPRRDTGGATADELAAERAMAQQEVDRARAAYDNAVQRSRQITKAMNIALRHLRRVQVLYKETDTFQSVTPKPIKGDPNEVIARIDAETLAASKTLRPQDEVVAEAMAQVDALAKDAKVRVGFGKQTTVGFPVTRVNAEPSGEDVPHAPDPRPWLARFFRDELEADIRAQVAAKYEGVTLTLSERDKAKRLAELAAERLNADRIRCAAIWDAYGRDPTISLDFPADADARAILGIEGRPVRLRDDED
jgi:hypothetical protein